MPHSDCERAAPEAGALITLNQLLLCMPGLDRDRAEFFLPPLIDSCELVEVNTPLRLSAFLAQIGHETNSFQWFTELASGKAYDTGRLAERLGNTPAADGDGQLYKGRGAIMVTGYNNYLAFQDWLFKRGIVVDLVKYPQRAADSDLCFLTASWYWQRHNLNALADARKFDNITVRINGGTNGKADRDRRYVICKGVFGCA